MYHIPENVIDANIKACKADTKYAGEAFNFASGGREYLIDVYNLIAKELGKEHIKPVFGPNRPGDIKHSNADISLAKDNINYSICYSFDEGTTLLIRNVREDGN